MSSRPVQLWSDEPSPVDLLAFGAVAETAVEAALDDALDPIALGISGPWGSGKSTVLKLIRSDLASRGAVNADDQILVVETDPWRYDPDVGAKATLILEVLSALTAELENQGGVPDEIKDALKKLVKRVNWAKALKLAARTSVTLQFPDIDDLSSLVSESDTEGEQPRNLDEFRREFAGLLADEHLSHLRRVVVLVDDLDRCLPDTVVETLETMRLFLAVPKMSFVIAADEDRVADALRGRYPEGNGSDGHTEEPARLYLHKIVQTTLRLPALSRFDTEAYLVLLLLQRKVEEQQLSSAQFERLIENCAKLRIAAGTIDSIEIPDGLDMAAEMQFAARLTPILYEKLRGSPRRVKRFLNDLNVRSSIAERRGIELDVSVVAKLMVLELLMPEEFDTVLSWLAAGGLRRQLTRLEEIAGALVPTEALGESDDQELDEDAPKKPRSKDGTLAEDKSDDASGKDETFTDNMIRWAKLPPSLEDIDLSPYLHLAASFAGTPLIDMGLPERLRDVAANLLSSSRASQKSVTDADLLSLSTADVQALIEHLGRMARDRPGDLLAGVAAILRVARLADAASVATTALAAIPVAEIKVPVVLLFASDDAVTYQTVLERWRSRTTESSVKKAVETQLNPEAAG